MTRFFSFCAAAMICMAAFASCNDSGKEFTAKLRGEVVDRPNSSNLYMWKITEPFSSDPVVIPIVDGKFEYDIVTNVKEAYSIVFEEEYKRGSMKVTTFFAEPGTARFILYDADRQDDNEVRGGRLTKQFNAGAEYSQKMYDEVFGTFFEDNENIYTNPAIDSLQALIEETGDESLFQEIRMMYEEHMNSPVYREFENTANRLSAECRARVIDYYKNHPSLATLATIAMNTRQGSPREYMDMFIDGNYAEKYADHPYVAFIEDAMPAIMNIREGGRYIDFALPDFEGNSVTVSEYIDGKIALIDLWMTWCGGCRSTSMSVIPVYEEFKERGFTVVGVCGDDDLEQIRSAAEKDGYPWITLVDQGGNNRIWAKYGISGSGGGTYLVDLDGTILAVNPNAVRLREVLLEKL